MIAIFGLCLVIDNGYARLDLWPWARTVVKSIFNEC